MPIMLAYLFSIIDTLSIIASMVIGTPLQCGSCKLYCIVLFCIVLSCGREERLEPTAGG